MSPFFSPQRTRWLERKASRRYPSNLSTREDTKASQKKKRAAVFWISLAKRLEGRGKKEAKTFRLRVRFHRKWDKKIAERKAEKRKSGGGATKDYP